jgi:hypothetical protein
MIDLQSQLDAAAKYLQNTRLDEAQTVCANILAYHPDQ